ncbi:Uncharacterized conserved protein YcfJ, contains glycine zipper 2TM domain [Andreprevotia lacus DSM 23236]|jgi:uncharacterized protein YcfJ|uniref:Uncharacterized conserved protein YcfJ, contains glycine zipper 2TM domain n=1 Tax=Andreprevotia lacus DSM 23236 TaxID=1121001 RepID=A0A1W1WX08_9NEIS|nr:glycine zipper 2TM domain-containing protein [Andreprevotia lacus]SMC16185.1 Uncharacterized conserved protein YcfJ, contains glycine zipper 2TM domain [Andreprevotia lacus DSM 23236]
MKTPYIHAMLLLLAGVSAASQAQEFYDQARVLSSTAQVERINTPRKECWTESREVREQGNANGTVGAVIGGVAGGVLGHQVGGGRGRDAATVAGAIAGTLLGNHLASDEPRYSERDVQRCRKVDAWEDRVTGYLVTYEYRGHTMTTTLPQQPGATIPVRVDVTPG